MVGQRSLASPHHSDSRSHPPWNVLHHGGFRRVAAWRYFFLDDPECVPIGRLPGPLMASSSSGEDTLRAVANRRTALLF